MMDSHMALFRPILSLLLVVTAATEVYGCVCYVGQEPNQATGKRYGWSLAEQRPCECTKFRLGGVNMKPQIKPYEVNIGQDCKGDQHAWTDPPHQVPGLMKHVSIGEAGVWAVDVQNRIYSKGSCGSSWKQIQGKLKQLDVGMNVVWGTNLDDNIYYRKVSVSNPDITGWFKVQGSLKHVSVSQKGHVWGVYANDKIYHLKDANVNQIAGTGKWINIAGTLKQVSVGSGGVWGISQRTWYRVGTYGDPNSDPDGSDWQNVGPADISLKYVSSGDVIFVVDVSDAVYYRVGTSAETPKGTVWQQIDGNLKQIESISSTFWGVDGNNSVYTNESLPLC